MTEKPDKNVGEIHHLKQKTSAEIDSFVKIDSADMEKSCCNRCLLTDRYNVAFY